MIDRNPMADQQHVLNLPFVEELYARYLRDARDVPADWRGYFERITRTGNGQAVEFHEGPTFKPRSIFHSNGHHHAATAAAPRASDADTNRQHRVDQLVRNYRVRGHMIAQIDPLNRPFLEPAELDYREMALSDDDLDRRFSSDLFDDGQDHTLREILERLRNTYCRHIGSQFMHIDDLNVRRWLQRRMEIKENRVAISRDEQLRILKRLTDAVVFEQFLQKKYIGAKTFSLEGGETLIPLLDLALEKAADQGVEEVIIAMSHRGRLNVLANIMGKKPQEIFREFEDADPELYLGGGDVKYHLGYSNDWTTKNNKKLGLSLCFNPSHLEFINPVAIGRVRAKQDRIGDTTRRRAMGLLIHGDAAFAGEGVVQETLNLSQLEHYAVGGSLHIIVNNQIGFTTTPEQYRSSTYCTDVAKMLQAPIFHVNGEAPEAVAQVVRLAMDFRSEFQRDVFIDMYCFRRRGHNEGDEPSFTQPMLYHAIEDRKSVRESYVAHLLELGGVTEAESQRMVEHRTSELEHALEETRKTQFPPRPTQIRGIWDGYVGGPEHAVKDARTGIDASRLAAVLEKLTQTPDDFRLHPKLVRFMQARRDMAQGRQPLDWSAAEALAFATLLLEGHLVRLTGQDSERGTFSHRHAVLHDIVDGHTYIPLQNLADNQASVEIANSPLSEASVLGFEYGYSMGTPDGLVIWEAQFGDFWNAAQVIVDQFIVSAEEKWRRYNGLVLLLPHGFEGQGPEHSSARLERFLMLAARDNMQIVNPTTPAQLFHALRRQVIRPWRKPLIVLTPKSLLRHKLCVSPIEQFTAGTFQRVIPDGQVDGSEGVERVLLCSGKIYYELLQRREELHRTDVAIIRMEQLYPFPDQALRAALARYADDTQVIWVQEEPENMGAWPALWAQYCNQLFDRLPFSAITRVPSASPATGSPTVHRMEQDHLLAQAFGGV